MSQIAILILALLNIVVAGHHANLIKEGKRIRHFWWGLGFFVLTGVFAWGNNSWLVLFDGLLVRKVVFDLSLNLFRGKPLFYVSSKPESLIDKWHNKVFGLNSVPYMVFYFISAVVITIFL